MIGEERQTMSERERVARELKAYRDHLYQCEDFEPVDILDEALTLLGERQEPVGVYHKPSPNSPANFEWIGKPIPYGSEVSLCLATQPASSVEREFIAEIARGPYPDSDPADLLSTIVSRARAILAAQEGGEP
jgi:hypothetical protein